jgi:paraquat-inducible protein B
VTVGRVRQVTFAPDHHLVEVGIDFDVATLRAMGMDAEHPPPDARAQLASTGLVGGRKFIALDTFDPETHPAPRLSFAPRERYIPSTPSVEKNLETLITKTLTSLSVLADSFARAGLADQTSGAVANLDGLLTDLDRLVRGFDHEKLPVRTAGALDDARATIARLKQALDHLDSRDGLLTAAQRAATSVGEVGRNAGVATRDLEGTLDDIRAASSAIRELAEAIEQHPDMLLKGRRTP